MSKANQAEPSALIPKIREIIPIINRSGKKKGAAIRRCMITLYAASHIATFSDKALASAGSLYFTVYGLSQVAADSEGIFHDRIIFDRGRTAEKLYKVCEKKGYAKFLTRRELLPASGGDTTHLAITNQGEKYCERIFEELLSIGQRQHLGSDKSQEGSIFPDDNIADPINKTELVLNSREIRPKVFKGEKTVFVGRERQLQELERIIRKSNALISLVGEGGIGKSSLAFRLINNCQDVFDYIIPIYFESAITFEAFILEIAKKLRIFSNEFIGEDLETRRQIVLDTLARAKHPLIFADNYETISEAFDTDVNTDDARMINSLLESVPRNTYIILTSRHKSNLAGEHSRSVHGLTEDEGAQLFIQISKRHFFKTPSQNILKEIKKISAELGGHPLSLRLLAGSYQGGGISELQSIVKKIPMHTTNELEEQKRLRSINNCFDYSFDRLSDKNKKLLLDLSLFRSPFLNTAIKHIFNFDEERLFDLLNRSFILRRELEKDPFETLHTLYDFHPVIKKYLEEKPNEKRLFLQRELSEAYCQYYKQLSDYIHHVLAIGVHNKSDFLLLRAFNLMIQRKQNDFEQAIEITNDPEDKSFIANRLSLIMRIGGLPAASLYYAKKSLEIDLRAGDLRRIANDYTNIGNVLIEVNDYDRTLECYQKALDIRFQLNDSQEKIAEIYINIGNIFNKKGDLDKALEYYQKSNQINKNINDEYGLAHDYTNIGSVLLKKGNLNEALAYEKMALKLDEKFNNMLDIATDYSNLGVTVKKMGDLDKALKHHNKALDLDNQIDNKKGMIRDCENIAKILESKGEINKSRKYAARAQDLEFDLQSTDTNYYKLP